MRSLYDELAELGGIPGRPWVDYRAEGLTDEQRGDDDGEEYIISLYLNEWIYWQEQLRLWKRYMQRRRQDGEPDVRDVDRFDVVAAFVAYLRGHLQRDMQERAEAAISRGGVWLSYSEMAKQRWLIKHILESLPAAEALLRRMRSERGDEAALRETEVTSKGLEKEYNIPGQETWVELWKSYEAGLRRTAPEPQSDSDLRKRCREDNVQEEAARSPKRVALDTAEDRVESSGTTSAKPVTANGGGAEAAARLGLLQTATSMPPGSDTPSIKRSRKPVAKTARSIGGGRSQAKVEDAKPQPPSAVNGEIETEGPKLKLKGSSVAAANGDVRPRPGQKGNKVPDERTKGVARRSRRSRRGACEPPMIRTDAATGLRRSARIAARKAVAR